MKLELTGRTVHSVSQFPVYEMTSQMIIGSTPCEPVDGYVQIVLQAGDHYHVQYHGDHDGTMRGGVYSIFTEDGLLVGKRLHLSDGLFDQYFSRVTPEHLETFESEVAMIVSSPNHPLVRKLVDVYLDAEARELEPSAIMLEVLQTMVDHGLLNKAP